MGDHVGAGLAPRPARIAGDCAGEHASRAPGNRARGVARSSARDRRANARAADPAGSKHGRPSVELHGFRGVRRPGSPGELSLRNAAGELWRLGGPSSGGGAHG
jgi:hypothetical protein